MAIVGFHNSFFSRCDLGEFEHGFHPKISSPEDDVPFCIDRERSLSPKERLKNNGLMNLMDLT